MKKVEKLNGTLKKANFNFRLADLCTFCADVTAACPILAGDWIGALRALCFSVRAKSMNQNIGFAEMLLQIEVNLGCWDATGT